VNDGIASVSIVSGWLPVVVDAAALLLVVTLIGALLIRPRSARSALTTVVAGAAGAAIGLFLCWLLSDQLDLFDVSLSPISRAWVAAAFAAAGIVIAALFRRGRWHRVVAGIAIPVVLVAGAIGVNADFGQYTTIGSLAGGAAATRLPGAALALQKPGAPGLTVTGENDAATPLWREPARSGLPNHGIVGTVRIPATTSHFAARDAYVYLPPAALVQHPVALPVLILLSGQPGGPPNVILAGKVPEIMNAFAAAHHGLAPIVVVPDQLGAPQLNPMCLDSPLGNVKTYLTVDVADWIRTHLTVQTAASAWAIGGYSEGGTCSIQFGSADPQQFGNILDISGQLAPKNGSLAQTIQLGFGGDAASYRAALPESVLATNAPYRDTTAVFVTGQLDAKYSAIAVKMAAAASAAGMRVTREVSLGTAHDWHTVQWALVHAAGPIYAHLGLERPA
jgi:hypothetical protein